ncbi:MAG: sodium:solute symporter [Tenericutes bacterium HGW-Tenericutes-1]|jgi:GPH family glycoside/pentoside/hexuronide:cation symporter|nr:MAG: sodium:solute symporter [Tenericutes bacterium HGW-Tenericutes-1]PKM56554.1 MAG: sodium:solute symporter [Firmicutes bacterium HGW-Firmicutes-3]
MKKITKKVMWIFAIGQLGWSLLSGIIVNWLVYFYQPAEEILAAGHSLYISQGKVILGVLTIVGAIVALGRVFDAFTDPIIASMSDRSNHKLGRRIPFMRYSALPFALFTVLIFVMPNNYVSTLNNIWLVISVLLFYLFMTMYCTPYNALIPELGKTQNDKINISTFISITFILGQAIAFSSPFIWGTFVSGGMERISAIRLTFVILSALALIFMLIPSFFIREKDYSDTKPSKSKTFESLVKTFKNKNFRIFIASDISYWLALTIFQTGLSFFVVDLLKLEEGMISTLFLAMTFVSFIFYMPVNIIAKKIGKKTLVISAFVLFALVFVFTSFSGLMSISTTIQGYIIAVGAAIPMAVLGILPQAIVADIAQVESKTTGENREGMFFAARTFSFKLGQSIAILIFTSLATIGNGNGMGYRIALIVAVSFTILGAVILSRYNENNIIKTLEEK